jgi:hypothetical protein
MPTVATPPFIRWPPVVDVAGLDAPLHAASRQHVTSNAEPAVSVPLRCASRLRMLAGQATRGAPEFGIGIPLTSGRRARHGRADWRESSERECQALGRQFASSDSLTFPGDHGVVTQGSAGQQTADGGSSQLAQVRAPHHPNAARVVACCDQVSRRACNLIGLSVTQERHLSRCSGPATFADDFLYVGQDSYTLCKMG